LDAPFDIDLSGAADTGKNHLVVLSGNGHGERFGSDAYLQSASAVTGFSAKLVERALRKTMEFGLPKKYITQVCDLQEQADFALENSDSLVAENRARAALGALVRGRQEQLHTQESGLTKELSAAMGGAPIGKVNYRILTANKLSELLRVGAEQKMNIIKLAVFGRRAMLEKRFTEFLGKDIRLAGEGTDVSPSIVLLRAAVSRQVILYTVGIPSDCAQYWPVETWLQGFSAAVHCASDLSNIGSAEGRMLYTCLTQIIKEKVIVALPCEDGVGKREVDTLLSDWIAVENMRARRGNLQDLLREAIKSNG